MSKDAEEGVFRVPPEETAFKRLRKEFDKTHSVKKIEFQEPSLVAAMVKYALRMCDPRLISPAIRSQLSSLFVNNSFNASAASKILRE